MGKNKSAKQQVTEYKLSAHIGVSTTLDSFRKIYVNEKVIWSGNISAPATVDINRPNLFGGEKEQGGVIGKIDFLPGKAGQLLTTAAAAILGLTPATAPGYRGKASLFFRGVTPSEGFSWSKNVPSVAQNIWVQGMWTPKGLDPAFAVVDAAVGTVNPAGMVYERMVDDAKIPASDIDIDNFNAVAQTLFNEKLGLAMIWNREDEVDNYIQDICDHAQMKLYEDPITGKWCLKLIRADYDVNTLRSFDEKTSDVRNFQQKGYGNTINQLVLSWTNPASEQSETVTVHVLAELEIQDGEVISTSKNFNGVRQRDLAVELAFRELRTAAAPLRAFSLECDRSAWDVIPGEVILVSNAKRKMTNVVARVLEVDPGSIGNSTITLTCVEDIFSLDKPPVVTETQPPAWVDPSSVPTPLDAVQTYSIPYYFATSTDLQLNIVDLEYPETLAVLLGYEPQLDVQGYQLLSRSMGADGALAYRPAGSKNILDRLLLAAAFTPQTDLLPFMNFASDKEPRVGDFLFVGLTDSVSEVIQIVGGGDGSGWELKRGCLDTTPRAWPVGSAVWVVRVGLRLVDDATIRSAGETAHYKMLTQTSRGVLPEADAPVVQAALNARPHLPSRPADFKINGVAYGNVNVSGTNDLVFTWATRNRTFEDGTILRWTDPPVAGEYAQHTALQFFNGATKVYEYAGLFTENTLTLPKSHFARWASLTVRAVARKDDLYSLQGHEIVLTGLPNNPSAPLPPAPPPIGVPPSMTPPPLATDFQLIAGPFANTAGVSVPGIAVSGVISSGDPDSLIIRYKVATTNDWRYYGVIDLHGNVVRTDITSVTPGTNYDVQIAYGKRGEYNSDFVALGAANSGQLVASDTKNLGGIPAATVLSDLSAAESAAEYAQSLANAAFIRADTAIENADTAIANAAAVNARVTSLAGATDWDSATAYVIGNRVFRGGRVYEALANNTNSAPPNANWKDLGVYTSAGLALRATEANQSIASIEGQLTLVSSDVTAVKVALKDTGSQNRLYNPSFDKDGVGGVADGWAIVQDGAASTRSLVTSWRDANGKAQRIDFSSVTGANYVQLAPRIDRRPSVDGGERLSFSFYVRGTVGARVQAFIAWLDAAGGVISYTSFPTIVLTADPVRFEHLDVLAPAGTVKVASAIRVISGTVSSGYVEIDQGQLESGPVATGWRDNNLSLLYDFNATALAVSSLEGRVTLTEAGVAANALAVTAAQASANAADTKAGNAQTAAQNASNLAGGKGKVFFQNTAPDTAERLSQNLWIDTTGGANTPKRWNGTAWVAVTDKVATDAATAAANALALANTKADASAVSSLQGEVTILNGVVTAQSEALTATKASIDNGIASPFTSERDFDFSTGLNTWGASGATLTYTNNQYMRANKTAAGGAFLSCTAFTNVSGTVNSYVRIRLRRFGTGRSTVPLYWANEDGSFSEDRRQNFTVSLTTNDWQTIEVDLSGNTNWTGKNINRLRLDPFNTADIGIVDISWIAIGRRGGGISTTAFSLLDSTVQSVNGQLTIVSNALTGVQASLQYTGSLNRLFNPSFDREGGTTGTALGWSAVNDGATASRSLVTSWMDANGKAQRIDFSNVTGTNYTQISTHPDRYFGVEVGESLSGSAYIRGTVGTRVQPFISWRNAAGAAIAFTALPQTILTATPVRIELPNVLAPAGTVKASFSVRVSANTVSSGYVEIDQAQVESGPIVTGWRDNTLLVDSDATFNASAINSLTGQVVTLNGQYQAQADALIAVRATQQSGESLPSKFDTLSGVTNWTTSSAGNSGAGTVPTTGRLSIVTDSVFGAAGQSTFEVVGAAIWSRGVLPVKPNHSYRFETRLRNTNLTVNPTTVELVAVFLDASYASIGSTVIASRAFTAAFTTQTLSGVLMPAGIPANARYLRFGTRRATSGGGSITVNHDYILGEDVTDVMALSADGLFAMTSRAGAGIVSSEIVMMARTNVNGVYSECGFTIQNIVEGGVTRRQIVMKSDQVLITNNDGTFKISGSLLEVFDTNAVRRVRLGVWS